MYDYLGGGIDYDSGPYTVTFPVGVTSFPFDVPINNDTILEDNENFTLSIISNSIPGRVTHKTPCQAGFIIRDDESKW